MPGVLVGTKPTGAISSFDNRRWLLKTIVLPSVWRKVAWFEWKLNQANITEMQLKWSSVYHYIDLIMITVGSQITSPTVVSSTDYSDADQWKHQSSASLAFVWGIHRTDEFPTKGLSRGKCFHLMTSSWLWSILFRSQCAANKPCLSHQTHIARFMWPTWGPPRSCRPQVSPMLAPWTLLSGDTRAPHLKCISQRGGRLPLILNRQNQDELWLFLWVFIFTDTGFLFPFHGNITLYC